jgi:hypothetical protein
LCVYLAVLVVLDQIRETPYFDLFTSAGVSTQVQVVDRGYGLMPVPSDWIITHAGQDAVQQVSKPRKARIILYPAQYLSRSMDDGN